MFCEFPLYSKVNQLFIYTYPFCFRLFPYMVVLGFPVSSDGEESAFDVGDPGMIPGLGRSPGEGNIYPF